MEYHSDREHYLAILKKRLLVLPENEREAAIKFYEEYFADAGEENEDAVISELGDPISLADTIIADYRNTGDKKERTAPINDHMREKTEEENKNKTGWYWLTGVFVLLMIFALVASGGSLMPILAIICVVIAVMIVIFGKDGYTKVKENGGPSMDTDTKPHTLYRAEDNKKIFGVCGGFGEYFGIDATIIRLLWVVLIFVYGAGILAYLIAAIIMPTKSRVINK